jgi:hypothetical protein
MMPLNQMKFNSNLNLDKKQTKIETKNTKNINNFMNIFGVAPKKTNYTAKEKKETKKREVDCKTPEKEKKL